MSSTYSADTLRAELIRDEGLRTMPYRDTLGLMTIGVGRCIETRGISKNEALYLLDNDVKAIEQALDARIPWWRQQTDARQRALINMAMMGIGRLMEFRRMLTAWAAGRYAEAAAEALDSKWAHQVGARATRVADMIRLG
mgnify:CR=1 FL=1